MFSVASFLEELNLPELEIRMIMSMLDEYADELHSGNVRPVDAGIFGASQTGGQLGYHADTARRHVAEAVLDMVAGLRGYRDNLGRFAEDVVVQDEDAGARLTAKLPQVEACTSTPDFATPSACELPTNGEEGDQ